MTKVLKGADGNFYELSSAGVETTSRSAEPASVAERSLSDEIKDRDFESSAVCFAF